jgi:hypothetical protein
MAASLPGLPAELLPRIIESEPTPIAQKPLFNALRGTCLEINAKLVYFFGSRHLKNISFTLDEASFSQLQAISRSSLCLHVQAITIKVTTLFEEDFIEDASDTTDASEGSWYTKEAFRYMDTDKCICTFSESVANFIVEGSCSKMLAESFPRFFNLRSFRIAPPFPRAT